MDDPSPSSGQQKLFVSEDSQYKETSRDDAAPAQFSSGELQPGPEARPISSYLPEMPSEMKTRPDEPEQIPLTAEIFASGMLPSGTMLGHFMIKSYIGGGGMGRVYLATDTALDRNVAVKVLPRQRANDQSTVARFMNEARSAARLNHEHIAQIYFAGEQDGIPYIVFEYVEGTNIRTMVDDFDAFPLPQALNYLIQITHALAHAAAHGVVHRDVKPSNVLITREGRAKLIDMGLARLLDPSEDKNDLTASGVTLGTFDYISPEQARDPRNADIRSDIYSLGCTFFFMLSGRPPFPEGTVLQKLLQHQGDEPPDIRSFQPNIPTEVALLLQKMMAKDPKLRFQTPEALIEALVRVAKMIGLQPTGPGKLNWVMTPPTRTSHLLKHVPWIAALMLLLLAYIPLNLYWKIHLGKLDIPPMPSVEVVEDPVESSPVSPTARTAPSGADRPLREDKQVKTASLSLVSYASGPDEQAIRRRFFPSDGADEVTGHVCFSFGPGTSNDPGRGLAPAFFRETWSPFNRFRERFAAIPFSIAAKGPGEAETLPASPTSFLCVDPSGETSGSFQSLAVALAEADKGAVIELKWNNVMRVDPMALTGRQLTFVAARNHIPILQFEPSDSVSITPNSRSMITVSSSELEFRDLAIEMRIRQDVLASRWTLFEMIGSNKIRFDRCMLTIRNATADYSAYHQEVAFFRNSALPSGFDQPLVSSSVPAEISVPDEASSTVSGVSPVATEPIDLRLSHSMMRGEATGLQCEIAQPIEFRADRSMIALAKSFVLAEDSKRTAKPESSIQIFFDHVTYFGRQIFARQIRESFATEPLRLEIDAKNSIFWLNNYPLADFRGARLIRDAFDSFKWTGESNYFQGVSLGWRFRPAPSTSDGGVTYEMPLSEWKEKMNPMVENDEKLATRIGHLKFDEIRKPVHRLLPENLVPSVVPEFVEMDGPTLSAGASPEQMIRPPSGWTRND